MIRYFSFPPVPPDHVRKSGFVHLSWYKPFFLFSSRRFKFLEIIFFSRTNIKYYLGLYLLPTAKGIFERFDVTCFYVLYGIVYGNRVLVTDTPYYTGYYTLHCDGCHIHTEIPSETDGLMTSPKRVRGTK